MYKKPSKPLGVPSFFSAFWEEISALPFGRKLALLGSVFAFFFLLFPWFYEGRAWYNAFGKIFPAGLFLLLFAVTSFLVVMREAFWRKGYWFGISHQLILFIALALGMYTVLLQTFALSELLNYNPNTRLGTAGMLSFIAFGIGLGGTIISAGFFPKRKEPKLMDTPEKVDTTSANLKPEHNHLFTENEQ